MQVLSDADTLVHLAMHFAGHLVEREARLNQLLDLARFGHVCAQTAGLDWDLCLRRAEHGGVGRFVYVSLFLAHAVFAMPLPPDAVWQRLRAQTPTALADWLSEEGVADVLTSDYRRRAKGQDYRLTFLAAGSFRERLGIARFALVPPVGQLQAKYHVRQAWLGPLLYPRHVAERLRDYGRDYLRTRP